MAGRSKKKTTELAVIPSPAPPPPRRWKGMEAQRKREIYAVLFIAASVTVFLSLVSFPVGQTASWDIAVQNPCPNWMGMPGNLVAWGLFLLTGVCAYLVPMLLVACAWQALSEEDFENIKLKIFSPFIRFMGWSILLGCACALVALTLDREQGKTWIAGGIVGDWLAGLMLKFGNVGAYVCLLTVFCLTLLLTTNFLFATIFSSITEWMRSWRMWWKSRAWIAEFREVPDSFKSIDSPDEPAPVIAKPRRKAVEEDANFPPLFGLGLDEEITPPSRPRLVEEEDEEIFFQGSSDLIDDGPYPPVEDFEEEEEPEEEEEVVEEDIRIHTPDHFALREIKKLKSVAKQSDVPIQAEEDLPYELPSLDLVNLPSGTFTGPNEDEIHANKEILERTLAQFNISAKVVDAFCGPVVTRYELRPAPGVKVRGITNLQDDLALALQALSVRIIAPVPGKNVVGIEIPNRTRQDVLIREVLASPQYRAHDSKLTFAIGKTISGEAFVADLTKMPHLLIAGATGSGKSVGVNSLISSILFNSTPQEVRFLMVDPKRVELSLYQDIPHLLAPVVADPKQAAVALKWAVEEMETRYRYLSKAGVRDIREYNHRLQEWRDSEEGPPNQNLSSLPGFLPYIVIIIDELADLMMIAKAEVETNIARLAQMARAVGMHLVLATQRPSVNILTGVIKANFPSRIAFKVAQINDSRVIIDQKGAESLLGMGDMLFDAGGANKPVRLQGCYISTQEIERLVKYIKSQQPPNYLDIDFSPEETENSGSSYDESELDEMYLQAVDIVMEAGQASTSLLQRRLKIGYGRAARILDIMHERGLIGPPRGSKPREVIV